MGRTAPIEMTHFTMENHGKSWKIMEMGGSINGKTLKIDGLEWQNPMKSDDLGVPLF
jgi:hypothetical protein